MKKIVGLALILGAYMPVAAYAGGMAQPVAEPMIVAPVAPIAIAPNGDWTGLYAGAALGFGYFTAGKDEDGHEGLLGLNLGYRKDFGNLVLGGELGYSKNDIGQEGNKNQIKNTTSAKLMMGVDMGRALVYVSGGVTQADIKLGKKTASDNGYFGGLGVDYAMTDKWTVGGEVIASKYNDFDNSGININDTTLQLKVGYRF